MSTSDAESFQALSESKIYRDYANAFSLGTGLPLSLTSPEMLGLIAHPVEQKNAFCVLISGSDGSCEQCYKLQCKIESEAKQEVKTLKCFAGLCETAVPVRVGDNVIAFLRTGQILLQRPDKANFNKVALKLIEWGSQVDLKLAEEAFFSIRVFSRTQYESLVRLLCIFADHLAASANVLQLAREHAENPSIKDARLYISDHVEDDLSLAAVAKVVNVSASYFSQKFKQSTGMNFAEFVSRTRVEKARNLLQNSNLRVSEIAFAVGFQSLSQFNRAFKKVTGRSPSVCRREVGG